MSDNFTKALNHITSDEAIQPSQLYGFSVISKENLDKFQTAWPKIESDRREKIMVNLVEIAEHSFEVDFEPIFIIGLSDANPEAQANAIEGLWQSETPSLIPPLIHLLKTGQTAKVRAKSATALGQFIYLGELEDIDETSYDVVQQALLQTIRDSDEEMEVVRRSVEAISFCSADGISQIIENAYYSDEELMRVSAVFAMGRHGHADTWREIILTELDNTKAQIRFEAARAAGELQLKEAVPKLIEMVDQEADGEIQQSAIWSLGQIGGEQAQAVLEEMLNDDDEAISTAAEDALDELMLWSGENLEELFSYTIGDEDDDDIHIVELNGS